MQGLSRWASVWAQASGAIIRAQVFTLAHGEMSIGARHGLRAIGLMRLDSAGQPLNWHAAADTANNIDEASLLTAADFAWQFIQAIDSEA